MCHLLCACSQLVEAIRQRQERQKQRLEEEARLKQQQESVSCPEGLI